MQIKTRRIVFACLPVSTTATAIVRHSPTLTVARQQTAHQRYSVTSGQSSGLLAIEQYFPSLMPPWRLVGCRLVGCPLIVTRWLLDPNEWQILAPVPR